MRTISMWQPWASLIVIGAKKIETRHWDTKYRGPLLIHAAKKKIRADEHTYELISNLEQLPGFMENYGNLPYGAIIGRVDLVHTFQFSGNARIQLEEYKEDQNPFIPCREGGNDFDDLDETNEWIENIAREMAFGDFSEGRYGWELQNPVQFTNPIQEKGRQGFWNYSGPLP